MPVASWTTAFTFLFLTLCTLLYLYCTRKFNHWKKKNVPFVPPVPFFGNAFEVFTFRKQIGEFTRHIYESTTKPFIGFFITDEPYLLIRDPELVKTVLIKDFAVFSNRSVSENKKGDPLGSHILFILKNPDWRNLRRKISPVFTSGKMKSMYQLISEAGSDLIKYLEKAVVDNPVVDVTEVSAKYTTEAITSTAFGINANCFKNEDAEFRQVSRRVLNFRIFERGMSTTCYFIAPGLVKWFNLKFVDTVSADFLRNAFWKTMNEREQSKFVRNDLLDILIEIRKQEDIDDPDKLEGDKLVAQAIQFFLAGFETSSSAISFMLYELAIHKDIQRKLREEVQEVINKHGEVSYSTLKEMVYMDMCFKETLRKYPILSFLDRRCTTDYKIPGTDIILEKGSPVFISVYGLHYDHRYYPNPEQYDPTRFTEENIKKRPPFTYLPFGEGPRNCIGARFAIVSAKSALAKLLSEFEVDLSDQTPRHLKLNTKGFLLGPNQELYLNFKKC